MKRFLWIHGPLIFWALLIFYVSSISSLRTPDIGFSPSDKLAHIVEFGIFGFLLQRSFVAWRGPSVQVYILVFIIGVAYAGLDEVHQLFVPGRQGDWGDWVADSLGVGLSQTLYWKFMQKKTS